MIQVAWLTGHCFLSQFTVVKRSIRTLVTGRGTTHICEHSVLLFLGEKGGHSSIL